MSAAEEISVSVRPRIGFLGVGWIGRHRMQAIADERACEIVAIAEPVTDLAGEAKKIAPDAEVVESIDGLLDRELDGVVIATPSALHAEQSIAALERGLAVFCQKPLGRNAAETRAVIEAAKKADRLLGVDLSYRYTAAMRALKDAVDAGHTGDIYAVNLVFHNAYGPDKPWFYDPALSGGGCVMDLGIHLVDLALWMTGFPEVKKVTSNLFSKGEPLRSRDRCEDYAVASIELETGAVIQLACSWNLPAGCDAVIEATFFGKDGGVSMKNVNGSFYDFTADKFHGTRCERVADPPDAWGGRAAAAWSRRLAVEKSFDPEIESLNGVAATLDAIYNSALEVRG